MPWKKVNPMDEKLLFVADCIRDLGSFSALCERYQISRKTGYKWYSRYREHGIEGLDEYSRRPHRQPNKIPYRVHQAILEIRTQSKANRGAKKILALLQQRFPNEVMPSKTTINNILKQAGLVRPRKRRRRVAPDTQPFASVSQPNDVWSADFKGQFKLANSQWCYPLTVMDHQSRFLLACHGMIGPRFIETQRCFTRLFKEHGLPQRIRTDNGVPFATTATGGLSRLSVWWIRLGIAPERIEAGKPQQNGRHERMHRTLKHAVVKPPAPSFKAQQQRFDAFRYDYNHQRPHEALQQETPASHYQPSTRTWPTRLPEMVYPDYFDIKKVRTSGIIYWRGGQVYVSHLLSDEWVGMDEIDDGIWSIYFGPVRLGTFNERDVRKGVVRYWSIKV